MIEKNVFKNVQSEVNGQENVSTDPEGARLSQYVKCDLDISDPCKCKQWRDLRFLTVDPKS